MVGDKLGRNQPKSRQKQLQAAQNHAKRRACSVVRVDRVLEQAISRHIPRMSRDLKLKITYSHFKSRIQAEVRHLKLLVSTRSRHQAAIHNCTVLQAHTWIGKYFLSGCHIRADKSLHDLLCLVRASGSCLGCGNASKGCRIELFCWCPDNCHGPEAALQCLDGSFKCPRDEQSMREQ